MISDSEGLYCMVTVNLRLFAIVQLPIFLIVFYISDTREDNIAITQFMHAVPQNDNI